MTTHHNFPRQFPSAYKEKIKDHNNITKIPETSKETIIFPYSGWSKTFKRSYYNPQQTDQRASEKLVSLILSEVEAILSSRLKYVSYLMRFIFATFGCFVAGVLLLTGSKLYRVDLGILIEGVFVFIFAAIVASALELAQTKKATKSVCELFEKYNEKLIKIGLRWHVPEEFPMWIELHNDFRDQGEYVIEMIQPLTGPIDNPQNQSQQGMRWVIILRDIKEV